MTTIETAAVDIVIPTRNRAALVDGALTHLRQSTYTQFAVWIVDQSDDNQTALVVQQHSALDPRITYVRSKTRGANFARNEGVKRGTSEFIAFIDDDCRVAPDWLQYLVAELEQSGVWAVFGRVIPDHEEQLPPTTANAAKAQVVSRAIPMALKDAPERRIYEHNRFDLSFGHGANMGWRRDSFLQVGGFDGYIGAGGPLGTWDERDAGYRVLSQHHGRIVYTPQAVVYHRHWRDWTEVRKAYQGYAIGTGAAAGKYLRCGDWGGLYFLVEWFLDQGVRQILSGILKWQSWQKIQVGWFQLIYPWVGVVQGLRYPVDRKHILYGAHQPKA
ncbi:MAG: glycosyltransferase family 2 protein [Caldilineaceae bacterium]